MKKRIMKKDVLHKLKDLLRNMKITLETKKIRCCVITNLRHSIECWTILSQMSEVILTSNMVNTMNRTCDQGRGFKENRNCEELDN